MADDEQTLSGVTAVVRLRGDLSYAEAGTAAEPLLVALAERLYNVETRRSTLPIGGPGAETILEFFVNAAANKVLGEITWRLFRQLSSPAWTAVRERLRDFFAWRPKSSQPESGRNYGTQGIRIGPVTLLFSLKEELSQDEFDERLVQAGHVIQALRTGEVEGRPLVYSWNEAMRSWESISPWFFTGKPPTALAEQEHLRPLITSPPAVILPSPQVIYADVNNDGHEELIIEYLSGIHGSALKVFHYDREVVELLQIAELRSSTPNGFRIEDVEGDGRLEIVAIESATNFGDSLAVAPRVEVVYRWNGTRFEEVGRQMHIDES